MDKLVLPQGVGVVAVGLKTGLVLPNDDIAEITADTVAPVVADKDIICITEAVVARSQNQYVTCTELAADIKEKLNLKKGSTLAVISPIASRNRFSLIMKALALATEGGKVIVQLTTPYDEVGNQVMDEEYSTTRFRLKRTLKSLREARGNTPQFNVLIREIIAGLKLQEMGYNIISIRKITGQGIADLTVRTPEGRLAVIEVTFEDLAKAARKAVGIQRDVPEAEQALAVAVNLELKRITLVDANQYLTEPQTEPIVLDYGPQLSSYYEPDVIYPNELGERSFSHPITKMDYRELYLEMI
ncbi:MAG: coenzyme F420-0:L-glutamate ligase, partial [bacterium]